MKIFISWSGDLSKAVALAFREWLKLIFNSSEPFMSDEDIEKGTRGLDEIAAQLDETTVGLFCITFENLERPWINYEAGAISKEVGKGRLLPFLINLAKSDIPQHSPLTQFQMTVNNKDDIHKMIRSINRAADPLLVDEATLDRYFEAFWEELRNKIEAALEQDKHKVDRQGPSIGAMAAEILDIVRGLQRQRPDMFVVEEDRSVEALLGSGQDLTTADLMALGRLTPGTGAVVRTVSVFLNALQNSLGRMPTAEEIVQAMADNVLTKHLVRNRTMREQALHRARDVIEANTEAIVMEAPLDGGGEM